MRKDYPDTMWHMMSHSAVKQDAGYVYSDIDFYIMQKVVEQVSGKKLDQYVYENIYRPMGLTRIGYKPLDRFARSRIVPTERDTIFRKELVQGYVHDPGSAMYGGVAGHAGVFSNAMDLAELMQMLLNKGQYNGKQILISETVDLFTKRGTMKSRRGIGFDKPEPDPAKQSPTYNKVPLSVFGHTGFTGTSVWSDPDNNLTFIFLSNRVYPDAENPKLVKMNIRTDLQKIVYKALPKR
jgi:CubicO group peptidase (beta-lactamase class C family)